MNPTSFTLLGPLASSLAALALALGCAVEDGEQYDSSSDEGAETLDDGGEDDFEFRTFEGEIKNPWLGSPVRMGTTTNKSNQFSPTCAVSNSADVSYLWIAPFTGPFTFSTAGSSFDTVLHIRPFNNSGVTLDCNDNANGTAQSSITRNVTKDEALLVVIDGKSNQGGSFKLNVSSPCPSGCSTPPNQCHETQGQCVAVPWGAECIYQPKLPSSDCDDGNWCSLGSHCAANSCVPDVWRSCNTPPSDCHVAVGSCNAGAQRCDYAPKAAGSACNAGGASQCYEATGVGTCDGSGTCVGTPSPYGTPCDDGNPCTGVGTCDGAGGCQPGDEACPPLYTCTEEGCQDPCSPYGFQHCGGGVCCLWGSNCATCNPV